MSLVIVSYGEDVIHEAEQQESFTLNTEGTYMENDVEVYVGSASELPSATGVSF